MKRELLAAAFAVMGTTGAFAQYAGTQLVDRIGHGQDSIDCLTNLSTYKEYAKTGNYRDAYLPWKEVFDHCPVSQLTVYINGAAIMGWMIQNETDEAKKKEYFDLLMKVYDQRIQYMNELNSFNKTKTLKGTTLCRKAYDYSEYGSDKETAYNMFREAMNIVNNSEDENEEVMGYILTRYFNLSYDKFKADSNFREQFIKDYMECNEICDKMLAKANEEGMDPAARQKIIDQYDPASYNIGVTFAESKAADVDELIKIFGPKVEENKNDLEYLKSVLAIMQANNADDNEVYYNAAEYAYQIEPTYESAMGTGQFYSKIKKDNVTAAQRFKKALELCPNDKQKAKIAYTIAAAQAKSGNTEEAYDYIAQAKQYNPAMTGRCDFLNAQILAGQKQFDAAMAKCDAAAAADAAISGPAQRLKETINKVKAANAAAAAYNKAAAEAKAKKDKEDAFWNAK